MIPGFLRDFFFGGGVSMGVSKFYLGAHKSGKKEKYPLFNNLLHTISIMTIIFNDEYSHEAAGGTT